MILSGSTARGRRTQVSDVDYHVIGASSLRVADLPADIDLYADDVDRFWSKLRKGDDFAHWSVWYGCVLFDSGVMQEAAAFVAEQDSWPDPERKLRQAGGALDFAMEIVESGDYGAALEQTRGALSLIARWVLLSSDIFPLARDELAGQLEQVGQMRLAVDLRRSIWERPSLDDLRTSLARSKGRSPECRPRSPVMDRLVIHGQGEEILRITASQAVAKASFRHKTTCVAGWPTQVFAEIFASAAR